MPSMEPALEEHGNPDFDQFSWSGRRLVLHARQPLDSVFIPLARPTPPGTGAPKGEASYGQNNRVLRHHPCDTLPDTHSLQRFRLATSYP